MPIEFELSPSNHLFVYLPNDAAVSKIIRYLMCLREPSAEYYRNWNQLTYGDKERGKWATGFSWHFVAGPEMLRKLQARFPTQFTPTH